MADIILPAAGGAPDDSIPGTTCPFRSTTALAVAGGAPSKVSMDVPCRRSCMLCLDRDGKSTCAVAVIALELVGRA